jgi:hypothetical protein
MFRPYSIKKQHLEKHLTKWSAYLKLQTKNTSEPEALKLILNQYRLDSFYEYRFAVEGKTKVIYLEKDIVDVVVRQMIFNPNNDDKRLARDRAMEMFKPVF